MSRISSLLLPMAADPSAVGSVDCLACGACCATFRVSFYWAEAVVFGLPDDLVEQLTPWYACLAGTNAASPRCRALQGEVGSRVVCSAYGHRPSPCREVLPGDGRCLLARERCGLISGGSTGAV